MPSEFRNQKNLAEWVELDYFRRQRGLKRWRRILTWLTLAVCLAGVTVAAVLPHTPRLIQAGKLSSAHRMFHDDCGRCHLEEFQTTKKLLDWSGDIHVVSDKACTSCHDGPAHNGVALSPPACAECHREHRGRLSLARVADGHCTACHADLQARRYGGASGLKYRDVKSFEAGEHPDIAPLKDAGQLHFNHAAHLKEGGILGRDRKMVQLQCIECHRPDPAGRYMQPINYEQHCAQCHPLSIQLSGIALTTEKLRNAVSEFNKEPAPHREPAIVRGVLRERLLKFAQDNPLTPVEKNVRLVDSALFGKHGPSEVEWQQARQGLDRIEGRLFSANQKDFAEDVLFNKGGGCVFCHIEEKRTPGGGELSPLPVYRKTAIETRWLKHARFSHERHRMLHCSQCHEAKKSEKTSDVLMPALATCQECHKQSVGVRTDCTECHSYHDRTLKHDLHKSMTIGECLSR
jgi:hypothetical protein